MTRGIRNRIRPKVKVRTIEFKGIGGDTNTSWVPAFLPN